jgi:hypothetical protein
MKHSVSDMFWGERLGAVTAPFGHAWTFATRTKDLTAARIKAAQRRSAPQIEAKTEGGGCSSKS